MDGSEALSLLRDYFALNTTVRGASSRDKKCIAALDVLTPPPAEQASGEALRKAVLAWWEKHKYVTDSHPEDGERNLYSEPPQFVQIAMQGEPHE